MDFDYSMTQAPKKMVKAQNVVDVVVKIILACDQSELRFYGKRIFTVHLVGILRDLKITPNEATCFIEDHTGKIKAVLCIDSDADTDMLSSLKQNSYVSVHAVLRLSDDDRYIVIIKIVPIDDANALTNHLLQFVHNRLNFEAQYKSKISEANSAGAALADALVSPSYYDVTSNTTNKLTPIQQEVLEIIRSEYSNIGIAVANILMQFPAYQAQEILAAVKMLNDEGLIYSTIDQEHFVAVI